MIDPATAGSPEPLPASAPATAIVAAMEANFLAFLPHFGCQPDTELHLDSDATWFHTRVDSTLFNQVIRSHFEPETADHRIREICAQFESRGGPFLWWRAPSSAPQDLGVRLEAHGLALQEQWPGMGVCLDELPIYELPAAGLRIERVRDRRELSAWIEVFAENFHVGRMLSRRFLEVWGEQLGRPVPPLRFYLGRWRDTPAATALLFTHSGVAGLYCLSTRPPYRRQGVGRAMTLCATHAARENGFALAVLQATSDGLPLYEALGFRRYCEFAYYFRQDELQDGDDECGLWSR